MLTPYIPRARPNQGAPPRHSNQGAPRRHSNQTWGFTLIELLISIAVIGILAATFIPSIVQARRSANDKAAMAYAQNVFKVAQAYVADNPIENDTVPTDCNTLLGYVAGSYSIRRQAYITGCTLNAQGSRIEVSYFGGTQNLLVLGE